MNILQEFNKASPNEKDPAKLILFTVFANLRGRVGFPAFWGICDDEVKEEILQKNLEEIRKILEERTQ